MEEAVQSTAFSEATTGLTQATTDIIAGRSFIYYPNTTAVGLPRVAMRLKAQTLLNVGPGGVGGMSGVLAGAPLDTVRIRQQQAGQREGAISMLRNISTGEGFRALFRGMSYPLATATLQNAVVFYSYGLAARHFLSSQKEGQPLHLSSVFLAGCFSGTIQTAIVTPVDLLKIRLQLQTSVPHTPGYLGPLGMLRLVLKGEGMRGMYRGTTITAIRDIPSHGVYFAAFEATRERLQPGSRAGNGKSSPWAVWAAGGIAGAISWLSVYPFDVIKSRIQATSIKDSKYRGWAHCAAMSYKNERGLGVFFKGMPATLCRAFLVNGAIFSAYEIAHDALS